MIIQISLLAIGCLCLFIEIVKTNNKIEELQSQIKELQQEIRQLKQKTSHHAAQLTPLYSQCSSYTNYPD